MNEAGRISAALGAAPEIETVAPLSAPARAASTLQAAAAILATLIAFAPSLLSLAGGVPMNRPLGAISLVPGVALGLAALVAIRPEAPGPEIHDRYLDYILGLAMLGIAAADLAGLPPALSIFFWSWRLDLLALPLFLAGAVTLLCGARTLWRYRFPIGFLLLAWPLPYAAAGLTGRFFGAAPLVVAAFALLAVGSIVRRRPPRSDAGSMPGVHPRPGGGLVAGTLVLVVAALMASADRHVGDAAALLRADGQPRLAAGWQPPANLHAVSRASVGSPAGPTWGTPASEVTYRDPAAAGTVVSVLTPADSRDLELRPESVVEGQGYHTLSAQPVDLGDAITGHLERYLPVEGGTAVTVVWWDWPVQAGSGVLRQRVIVERDSSNSLSAQLVELARNLVASSARRAAR